MYLPLSLFWEKRCLEKDVPTILILCVSAFLYARSEALAERYLQLFLRELLSGKRDAERESAERHTVDDMQKELGRLRENYGNYLHLLYRNKRDPGIHCLYLSFAIREGLHRFQHSDR